MELNRERVCLREQEVQPLGPLEELYRRALRALKQGDRTAARAGVETLGRSLETHFALEDRVYFPALAALRPDLGPALRRLRFEHENMLAWVTDVLERMATAEGEVLAEALDKLIATFERHEGDEETMLSSLDTPPDTR